MPLLVFMAVVVAVGAVILLLDPAGIRESGPGHGPGPVEPAAASTGSSNAYICLGPAGNGADIARDYCDRYVRDLSQRAELTQAQRDALDADRRRVEYALSRLDSCAWPSPSDVAACARSRLADGPASSPRPASEQLGPADVEAVQAALRDAGFNDALVRLARSEDPATDGSIFLAVPLKDACLLGYLDSLRAGGNRYLAGRLPNGRCV